MNPGTFAGEAAAAILAALLAFGCTASGPQPSAGQGAPTVYAVVATASAPSSLPKCTPALAGDTIFVGSPPSLWYCTNSEQWKPIACNTNSAGSVAYASASETLWACVGQVWTQIALPDAGPPGPQGPPGEAGSQGPAGPQGDAGAVSIVVQVPLAIGDAHCSYGGTQIESGVDANGDGQLEGGEVSSISYVCNGAPGAPGAPGSQVQVASEPPGTNCPAGGERIEVGVLADGGLVVTSTAYVCNGAAGGAPTECGGIACTDGGLAEANVGDSDAAEESTDGSADACQAAADSVGSVGCEFYATNLETLGSDLCFAAYVVNASKSQAHLAVDYGGATLNVASFTRIPSGTGTNVHYAPYDPAAGLTPGQAAVIFLAGSPSSADPCPVQAAVATGTSVVGTGTGLAFHMTTDAPVSAYEMNPYGGGLAGMPGASLLLPTSAWGTNYVVATAGSYAPSVPSNPSFNIVAAQDGTQVTIHPVVSIAGGSGLASGPASTPYTFSLGKGQQAQFSQQADLSGSVIQSNLPIAVLAGSACMQVPVGTNFCDHGEQMLPPVSAIGNEYAAVMFRPRVTGDVAHWRVLGIADGTTLTYSTSLAGAPTSLARGQLVEFDTDQPFAAQSQDKDHPFLLFAQMTGGALSRVTGLTSSDGYGDPDTVLVVPPSQFSSSYTFTTDPLFPETNLVVVRAKDAAMAFDDVTLDCAGTLTGWQALGAYEWTRIDLTRHDFQNQGACTTGPHSISSAGPFGLWVWGWGSPETASQTTYVSYGYPAGMNVRPVNTVTLSP